MDHWVQYHNVEKMGGWPTLPFRVLTNKPANTDLIGARVWLILGEGSGQKRFMLHSTFLIDSVRDSDERGFHAEVRGSSGTLFEPAPDIESTYWWQELERCTGNFAFGFTNVTGKNGLVGGLRELGRSLGAEC